jgi:hypothetical protein
MGGVGLPRRRHFLDGLLFLLLSERQESPAEAGPEVMRSRCLDAQSYKFESEMISNKFAVARHKAGVTAASGRLPSRVLRCRLIKTRARGGPPLIFISLRQFFANAAIAASRVG